MNEFIDKNGITKLTWAEYKRKGDHLRKTKGFTAKQIKDLYGKPVIDGVVIEITTGGPNTIRQRSAASRAKSRANRKRKTGIYKNVDTLPTEIKKWAAKLTKENKWPEGKSLEGFIQSHESAQKKLMSDIEHLKNLGFIDEETGKSLIDDGHLIAIGKEQKIGHPLRSKGTHGSHFGEARVPELAAINQAKREAGDIDFLDARRGGIIDSDLEAFNQYLTDDAGFGPGVKPTRSTKQRIAQGANPDQAIESQIAKTETAKQRRAWSQNIDPNASKVSKAGQIASDIAKNTGKFAKVASGAGVAESLVLLGSGQVIPGVIGLGMQTPTAQKQAAKLLAKPVSKLLAKQGLKMIPGVSLISGVGQGVGYALAGQWGKAALSGAGGVIGELGPAGDAVQAMIDLGLTVSDVKQAKKAKADEPEIVEIKKKKNKLSLPGADDINSRNIVRSVTKAF